MNTAPNIAAPRLPDNLSADRITYGAVHLDVRELERSLGFWRDLIGLGELSAPAGQARLGVDGRALVVLHPGAVRPVGRGHAGLYHLAIHLPNATEFARILMRLGVAQVPQSPTDHIFSKATYLYDPDGIMLELTLETPERFGSIEIGPDAVTLLDSDGRRRAGTEPLDIEAALAPLHGGDPRLPLASGSYIGHVHLHVPSLRDAYAFYRDVIGFDEHSFMTTIGMADLGAGGRFPHRLAVNEWNGPRARQPAPGTAGLRRYELILRGEERLARVTERASAAGALERAGDGLVALRDPAGNEIAIAQAGA